MPHLLRARLPVSPYRQQLKQIPSIRMASSSSSSPETEALIAQVLKYHKQTKHSLTHYSAGPRGLDWANQPNPFRRYPSAPLLPLPISPSVSSIPYPAPFISLPSPQPLSKQTLSHFFFHSLALSAWKTIGLSTWSLRVNPSSGNLHPTEAYIVSPPVDTLSPSPFVAHYAPKEHSLELRAQISPDFFPRFFPEGSFLIGLSSIFWREAWKYGERAFRYCNHDVGHALAAVTFAAAELGWDVKILDGLGFEDLENLMGLKCKSEFRIPSRPVKKKMPEIEFEHPDCVLLVFPNEVGDLDVDYEGLSMGIKAFSNLEWVGKPNMLSKEHICWDIIYRTAEAVKKPLEIGNKFVLEPFSRSRVFSEESYKGFSLGEIARKRRSAVDMDGFATIEKETFFQILLHCIPSGSLEGGKQGKQKALPFRAMPWDSEVHCALFVHRVVGLEKGLYFLVRNEDHFDDLKKGMRSTFKWEKPQGCPDELPLYVLAELDCGELSKQLSCHQDIASDGCFSLGMVAHFEPTLRSKGVWMYPRLFWETGVLGQLLYLEAHAIGISATGIGCFFDDPVHEVLGLKDSNYQSLYHFTVGGPVVDKRIMSLPAYPGPDIDT